MRASLFARKPGLLGVSSPGARQLPGKATGVYLGARDSRGAFTLEDHNLAVWPWLKPGAKSLDLIGKLDYPV